MWQHFRFGTLNFIRMSLNWTVGQFVLCQVFSCPTAEGSLGEMAVDQVIVLKLSSGSVKFCGRAEPDVTAIPTSLICFEISTGRGDNENKKILDPSSIFNRFHRRLILQEVLFLINHPINHLLLQSCLRITCGTSQPLVVGTLRTSAD